MACTFVPDIPYDDTAARRGCWPLSRPWRDRLRHKQFRLDSGEVIGQTGEVQVLRDHPVLQRQDRLHQPHALRTPTGHARSWSSTDPSAQGPSMPYTCGQARVFDRVTDRGSGAVRLYHADGCRRPRPPRPTPPGTPRPAPSSDGVAMFTVLAILVGGGAAHHSQDPVAIPQGIGQAA